MKYRFQSRTAARLQGLDLLTYLSRVVGEDDLLVQHGGGNSSFKSRAIDPFGRKLSVIHIKGSGSDMRTITPADFVTLRLEDARSMRDQRLRSDSDMMEFMDQCLLNPAEIRGGGPRPSVETPLHVLVDASWVLHTHDYATEALTNTTRPREIVEDVYGDELSFVPYARPGLPLALSLPKLNSKRSKGLVLSNHGIVVWGATAEKCYDNLHAAINQAERYIRRRVKAKRVFPEARGMSQRDQKVRVLLPTLRGELSRRGGPVLLTYADDQDTLNFVGSRKLHELVDRGMVTPEHVLRAGRKAMVLEPGSSISRAFTNYEKAYLKYYTRHNRGEGMFPPRPKVILLPGLGMVASDRDKRNSEVARDCYRHGVRVIAGAEAVDQFLFLDDKQVFDFEYWELELLKLKKKQPELSGKVAFVTGAASGIGQAVADRLAAAGAHVVLSDRDPRVKKVAEEIRLRHDGRAFAAIMDVADEASVVNAFDSAVMNYGGVDILVSNAGYLAADQAEDIFALTSAEIRRHFDVNTIGPMLVTREAARIMKAQGLGGSIIFNASKAGYLAGKGLSSYGASKAAEINFARAAAQELGPLGIRVNYVNADMVDTPMFRSLLKKRARDGKVSEADQLAKYLSRKVLVGDGLIPPEAVAEAFLYLASDRSKFTTGCVLTVDRGLPEAFPR